MIIAVATAVMMLSLPLLWRDRVALSRPAFATAAALRLAAIALLVLALSGCDPVRLFRHRQPSVIAIVLDGSRSMKVSDGAAGERWTRANRIAARLTGHNKKSRSIIIASDSNVSDAVDHARLDRPAGFTDLGIAINGAVARRPDAVVLVSDGDHNRGTSPVTTAAGAGLPVHTIGLGPVSTAARAIISDIVYPDQAEANEQITILAAAKGGTGKIRWELRERGKLVSRTEASTGAAATLSLAIATPGLHRFQLAAVENEETVDQRAFTILAGISRIRISWLDFKPDWNLRFAAQALSADPAIRLSIFAKRAGAWMRIDGSRADAVPSDSIPPCDVLIINGGDGERLPVRLEQMIDHQVLGNGGGALVIGSAALPAGFLPLIPSGPAVSGEVVLENAWRQTGMFPEQDATLPSRIRRGPPMQVPAGLVRADSTVTVLASLQGAKGARSPLWAVRYSGSGRIMQFASGDLWKWKLALSGAQQDTVFFGQLFVNGARWLAGRSDQAFAVNPERSLYTAGERAALRGRWQRWDGPTGGAVRWSVDVSGPGGFHRETLLSDWGAGDFAAGLGILEPGTYEYCAAFSLNGQLMNQQRGEFYVEPGRDESQDLTQNKTLLRDIAAASGGRYFDADSLPADDAWLRETAARQNDSQRQGSMFGIILAVIGLLTGEWVIRRRHGLR